MSVTGAAHVERPGCRGGPRCAVTIPASRSRPCDQADPGRKPDPAGRRGRARPVKGRLSAAYAFAEIAHSRQRHLRVLRLIFPICSTCESQPRSAAAHWARGHQTGGAAARRQPAAILGRLFREPSGVRLYRSRAAGDGVLGEAGPRSSRRGRRRPDLAPAPRSGIPTSGWTRAAAPCSIPGAIPGSSAGSVPAGARDPAGTLCQPVPPHQAGRPGQARARDVDRPRWLRGWHRRVDWAYSCGLIIRGSETIEPTARPRPQHVG